MALSDITDRRAVLSAIEEFDRIGKDAFLAKYGFGEARSYWLLHEGRRYDSKAIIGAAHGYARPDLGPMRSAEFSGGEATVRQRLAALGFEVQVGDEPKATTLSNGFLLTWKETGWPYDNIRRMLSDYARNGVVEEWWRIQSHRLASPGDRAWLLKQGPGPKGIFGAGVIVDHPHRQQIADGSYRWVATVRFSRFVDPRGPHLIGEDKVREILPASKIRAQASGGSLTPQETEDLEGLLPTSSVFTDVDATTSDGTAFDVASVEDARERTIRAIALRRGQRAFRDALIGAYGGCCAISGCNVLDVLEAAHIYPYCGPETNQVQNGLLLRADLHTLFDCDLIRVDPATMTVVVDARLKGTEYETFDGRPLRPPRGPSLSPSPDALRSRRELRL